MDVAQAHPELHKQLSLMQRVHDSILSYEPFVPRPPILDSSLPLPTDAVPDASDDSAHHITGLRPLLETVRRDMDVMKTFLADSGSALLPPLSTNATYLIAVWKEVICASPPIIALGKTFFESNRAQAQNGDANGGAKKGKKRAANQSKPTGVKVDVVADNGGTWIRVNTTKNSRLLSEFREIDSYMTDSSDESDPRMGPSLAQTEFDNSLLRAGRQLLAAARNNPLPGTSIAPTVVFRLTRLDPEPTDQHEHDTRIALTIRMLREMGLIVELGERNDALLDATASAPSPLVDPPLVVRPTTRINLDLSVLIALVSDLTHASLPPTAVAAHARFTPSASYLEWKKSRQRAKIYGDRQQSTGSGSGLDGEDGDTGIEDLGKHSRALAEQLQQEMQKGVLQEMLERISESAGAHADGPVNAEFWTTAEARDRCLRIIAKIGGPHEKQRASALFPLDSTTSLAAREEQYWQDSRYPPRFLPILPIHVFPPEFSSTTSSHATYPLFRSLEQTCLTLLAQETAPHPRALPAELAAAEIQRATVMRANPRLTAHTVQSLLCGAVRGWTTLTANKASVKAVLKEMKGRGLSVDLGKGRTSGEAVDAVIWMVDPRSLAEGMRSDYGA
ncbi:hypothetical protein FA95DRAFT_1487539 [Auriscalpium vulgare]|uniref:Uncharacterized protein n=1 Tax=Auriscalpium vulgare TaxID=40419 RepID=A0ACB8S1V1_9AGAM|nr:hypothetical protein FA95DRAFT_1487539 [Auriscalpium vulgare]